MATPSPLSSLPTELLATVGEYSDRKSLLALRLTHRNVSAAVYKIFIDRYIKKRSHLFTTYGLQKLVEITRKAELSLSRDQYMLMTPWDAEHDWLINKEVGAVFLRLVFRCLSEAGQKIKVFVVGHFKAGDGREDKQPYGWWTMAAQMKATGFPGREEDEKRIRLRGCGGTVQVLLRAASWVVDAPIKMLDICYRDLDGWLSKEAFEPWEGLRLDRPHRWSALESLRLDIDSHGVLICDENWRILTHLLKSAPGLRNVSFAWSDDYYGPEAHENHLQRLGKALGEMQIANIEIQRLHQVPAAELAKFFESLSPDVLASIKLGNVTLNLADKWAKVFTPVLGRMRLTSLELEDLQIMYYDDGGMFQGEYLVDEGGSTHLSFEGKDAVERGLTGLVQTERYMDQTVIHCRQCSSRS